MDSWASPHSPPSAPVVVDNGAPGAASAPLVEGLRAGRMHLLNGSVLFLVGGGSTGHLAMYRMYLKITALILLILLVLYIHICRMKLL